MGMMRSIGKEKRKKAYSDNELFSRYIKMLKPFKKYIILIAICIILQTIADLVTPLLVKIVSDELVSINPNFILCISLAFLYLFLSVLNWIGFFLQRRYFGLFIPYFLENLRKELYKAIQKQDMTFFDKRMTGRLNSIIVNDTLDFTNTALLISTTIGNILISVLTFVILLYFNVQLALIAIVGIPVLFFLMYTLRKLAKRMSQRYRVSIGNVNSAMVESIEGIQISKSFGQEVQISDQFDKINDEYFKSWFQLTAITHFWRPMLNTLTSVILCIIFYYGANYVIGGSISPGVMIMFILYLQNFFRPIMILARFFPELNAGMAAYERILNILDAESTIIQNPNPIEIEKINGAIEFKNVKFGYNQDQLVFKNLSLSIKPGEKLAIVGHTGAGKTSLISLLARNYEFQEGSITVDGINIRDISLESYRENLGKVEQNVYLFPGTLEENIRYGRQDASIKDIERVIRIVQAEEFIKRLPNGLQTYIGSRGRDLSAGQRQLISFARAILRNPRILILDEATASVDAYTEAMIQESLEKILETRTAIIIAHRLSTIVNADRIIVMENGDIIEEGTHQQLLKKQGKYSQLYNQYFAYQSIDWQKENAL